jgi:hypothetical protein
MPLVTSMMQVISKTWMSWATVKIGMKPAWEFSELNILKLETLTLPRKEQKLVKHA